MTLNCSFPPRNGCALEFRIGSNFVNPLVCVVGVVTNALNLAVFYNRHFKLISSSVTYMKALAFVDGLTCLLSVPYGLGVCNVLTDLELFWWYRSYICFIYYPIVRTTGACSVYVTLAMTIDRLFQLKRPADVVHGNSTKSAKNASIAVVTIYILLQILHLPFFFVYTVNKEGHVVKTKWRSDKGFPVYMWISNVLVKLIPIICIIPVNMWLVKILVDISQRRRELKENNKVKQDGQTLSDNKGCSRGQRRVTLMLLVVSVVFVVCQGPALFGHAVIYNALAGPCGAFSRGYRIFTIVVKILELVTFASNFVPYVICNAMFRQVLMNHVCNCRRNNRITSLEPGTSTTGMAALTMSRIK